MSATAARRRGSRLASLNLDHMGRDISLMIWGMVIWDIGLGLYMNVWPIYVERLGASPSIIGVVIGLQAVARLSAMLPSGIMADRFDRRRVMWIGTAASVPAAVIFGLAQTWWQILPGLVFWALTNLTIASISSYIAEAAPARERARAFSLVYTVGPAFAFIIGPILGGWLGDRWGIRPLLFIAAALFAISTWVFSLLSTRPLKVHHGQSPATYGEAFRDPAVRAISLLQMGTLLALTIGITFIPNYLQDEHGMSLAAISRYGAIGAAGSIVLSLAVGKRRGLTPARGIAISAAGVAAVCVAVVATGNVYLLAAVFLMRGWFSVAWSMFGAILADTTPERLRGRAFALAEFAGGIGFALAPFVAGPLYGIDPRWPLLVAAVATPALLVATLVVERRIVRPALALG